MTERMIVVPALLKATLTGTLLQLAMVVAGHFVPAVAMLFGLLGVTLSFLAGLAYAVWARRPGAGGAAAGGALAGGLCALLGIAVSVALGDVPPVVLTFGTASSAVTGALGGLLGNRLGAGRAVGAV